MAEIDLSTQEDKRAVCFISALAAGLHTENLPLCRLRAAIALTIKGL
ncbi:hypothetical protein JNB91_21270 [Rhizobium wenxiniae]|nr:hypothetical protein [Rhizobium wenxiniae]MBW9090347.1 hypothetical protein [Rhizobium wenxiniae]